MPARHSSNTFAFVCPLLAALALLCAGCAEETINCPDKLTNCDNYCYDLASDPRHCGACGTPCAQGMSCVEGGCQLVCQADEVLCGNDCVDPKTDRAHCGECGKVCAAGEVCSAGACALSCQEGLTDCDGGCVDLETARAHCGECGKACAAGEVCSAGQCELSCQEGLTDCDGTCVDTQHDRAHCGDCATVCDAGEVCSEGACSLSCAGGLAKCGESCVDLKTDRAHCGDCATTCEAGEVCSNGACALSCQTGLTKCGTTCVDTETDRAHCGDCTTTCGAGEVCAAGECTLSCQSGLTKCGDKCVDTKSDLAHCGGCSTPCDPGEFCDHGGCTTTCSTDLKNCGGTCVDPDTDRAHCGACLNACAGDEICASGSCVCPSGQEKCGDACVNTQTSYNHCGECGTACKAGEVCSLGECKVSCQSGLTDCGGQCVDLDNDPQFCGACDKSCGVNDLCQKGLCYANVLVDLQLLNVSDWHGQLDPLGTGATAAGGAAALSAYFKADRVNLPNTLTLAAGDAYAATPPLSAFFDDEPAVEAMNLMGFSADTLGNHNFDKGLAYLRNLMGLASFPYVVSNLSNLPTGAEALPNLKTPFHIVEVGGVRVALIGLLTPDAPGLQMPGAMGSITIDEPIAAANAARAAAYAAGARVFVALAHLGATGVATDGTPTGPLGDLAAGLTGFHVVYGDHTDVAVNATVNGARVVQNRVKGATYSRIKLKVVPLTGQVASVTSEFVTPTVAGVTPDQAVVDLLAPYKTQLATKMDVKLGVATAVFPQSKPIERKSESALGNLLADAWRAKYTTDFALFNGGGLRASLPSPYVVQDATLQRTSAPYDLVVGDAYAVLPFGNIPVTVTVTGTQLWQAMENGVSKVPAEDGRFPQVAGFKFYFDPARPAGSRVAAVMKTDGTPIAKDATTYTLATANFLAAGGDGYTCFAGSTVVYHPDVDAEVLADYIQVATPLTPVTEGRSFPQRAVGETCAQALECAAGVCDTAIIASGYCTLDCTAAGTTCPVNTTCTDVGGGVSQCLKNCAANADCREADGFTCTTGSVCWKI